MGALVAPELPGLCGVNHLLVALNRDLLTPFLFATYSFKVLTCLSTNGNKALMQNSCMSNLSCSTSSIVKQAPCKT